MFGRSTLGRYVATGSVGTVLGIYGGEWIIYHFYCHPKWFLAIPFNATWAMAVWCYMQTTLTDPGTVQCPEWVEWSSRRTPAQTAATSKLAEEEEEPTLRASRWRPGEATWCKICCIERPERAHHCSQCGVCILRMDHHCPWIGTCVGWRNHKNFWLMTFWTFWASFSFLATLRGPTALEAMGLSPGAYDGDDVPPSMVPCVGVLGAFVFALVCGGMCLFVLYMAATNTTVVEELISGANPYRLPHMSDNLQQLLGKYELSFWLPTLPQGRPSGTAFPVSPSFAGVSQYGAA